MEYTGEKDIEPFLNFLEMNSHEMKPYTNDEIEYLTKNYILPNCYIKFIKRAGNGMQMFRGSDYSFEYISTLKKWAIELLEENEFVKKLSENDFVFMMHQGYVFYFFNLEEGDDPPVYYYGEGENMDNFFKISDTFSGFLIDYYNRIESLKK